MRRRRHRHSGGHRIARRPLSAVERADRQRGDDEHVGFADATREQRPELLNGAGRPVHWMDGARQSVRLARSAAEERGGCSRETAVASASTVTSRRRTARRRSRLLAGAFEDETPHRIRLETLWLVRGSTYAAIDALLATGLPVWLSFRRCRYGICGAHGGAFGRARGRRARPRGAALQGVGRGRPADQLHPNRSRAGGGAWQRDFTDLPLGVTRTSATCRQRVAVRDRDRRPGVRRACAAPAGGARPDYLRVLQSGARARRRRSRRAGRRQHGHPAHRSRLRICSDGRGPPRLPGPAGRSPACCTDSGQLPDLEGPLPSGHRRGPPCLDIGCDTGLLAVQMVRNLARTRDRHRSGGRRQHAHQTRSRRSGIDGDRVARWAAGHRALRGGGRG